MTRLYVSGPIKADPDKAPTTFYYICRTLNTLGYLTVNPFDCGMIHMQNCDCYVADRKYRCNLRADIKAMMDCDGIALMEGWETSKGCIIEYDVATRLEIPTQPIDWWISRAQASSSRL